MRLPLRRAALFLLALMLPLAGATHAYAWAHQGHILITRLAALRIINDPQAPAGLRDFLKANMPYTLDDCRKLATQQTVGPEAEGYLAGLDGACTLPDRIQATPAGKALIEPYGAPEAKMHFADLEWLGPEPLYKPDLSDKPNISAIPHDLSDPRWKEAGFVPFRVEEFYNKTVHNFAEKPLNNAQTMHDVGYLLHYLEDCTQPHHATIDYKSYSYVAGRVKAVHEVKTPVAGGKFAISYRSDDRNINPHGDLEFQLFENAEEPRKSFRTEFWRQLTARIDALAKAPAAGTQAGPAAPAGSFTRALEILADSYEYLPAVGKAAQAAYAHGHFDPEAFFTSRDRVRGDELTTVALIAQRNAVAVLEVEKTLRHAWAQADSTGRENR